MSNDSPESGEIYNQRLLALADDLSRTERLDSPDATAWVRSRLCGSEVTVDLKMDGPVVTDFAHEVKACKLGTAAAAVMARHVVGSSATELRELRETMRTMLKQNGPAPTGKWSDLEALLPARKVRSRHPSIMLTFDAVTKAISEIEARRGTGPIVRSSPRNVSP